MTLSITWFFVIKTYALCYKQVLQKGNQQQLQNEVKKNKIDLSCNTYSCYKKFIKFPYIKIRQKEVTHIKQNVVHEN